MIEYPDIVSVFVLFGFYYNSSIFILLSVFLKPI